METISGASNWRLTIRREASGVTILKALTCDRRAILPGELFGLPVTALGDRCLAPGRAGAPGEELCLTTGPAPESADWDNSALEELQLPESLVRVGDYAFYNCGALTVLRLRDTVRWWGGGALMNCRALRRFLVECTGREGELLHELTGELSRELDITLLRDGETAARLIFPAFFESYEENCPAHHFDYNIYGAGYGYHHCFTQRELFVNIKLYDELWRPMLGLDYEEQCAVELAWWRLRTPLYLGAQAEGDYRAFLREHGRTALWWLLGLRDTAGVRFLLDLTEPDRKTLADACALAREQGSTELLALLLEEQHRRFPAGAAKSFEL